MKKHIPTLIKLTVATALVVWMVRSGQLNFSSLVILLEQKRIIFYTIAYWLCIPVLLAAYRWYLLLHIFDIAVKFKDLIKLHLTSLFFNSCLPGAFGGDVMKVYYIVKNKDQIASGLSTIFLDRIFGLIGLTLVGTAFIWNVDANDVVITSARIIFSILTACFIMAIIAREKMLVWSKKIIVLLPNGLGTKLLTLHSAIGKYLKQLKPNLIILMISVVIHISTIFYFSLLTNSFDQNSITIAETATIFAIGGILIAIPISPSGIGVGHFGFAYLFGMFAVQNGADIFNIFVLLQIALNLIGIIPYIFLNKDKIKESKEYQAE